MYHHGFMAVPEPRTFRNWHAIAYFATGMLCFALVGALANPTLSYFSIPCGALLFAATRQHVIVYGTEVELHNVVRHHRLALSQIDHMSVHYLSSWGWRIRLYFGPRHVDTFAFFNLAGLRFVGTAFPEPPADAPAPVKELHALLSTRMAALQGGT
jgi:hypothetical protein